MSGVSSFLEGPHISALLYEIGEVDHINSVWPVFPLNKDSLKLIG